MYGYIDGYDFGEMEAMKYWAPPSTWSDEKKRDNARAKIFSGDYFGAEKKDGYFAKLIKDEDGNIILYSRSRGVNGKFADKHEWVPQLNSFFETLPLGTCVLGELYFPSAPGSRNVTTIMGCLKEKAIDRQAKGEKLHFYVFDILAWGGKSWLNWGAKDRFSWVSNMIVDTFEYVSFARYKTGKELWSMLQEVLARGDEGVVITHCDGLYEPGKRPSKTTLKIKKELHQTIDCFFTGVGSLATRIYTGKEIETWPYWENINSGEKLFGKFFKEYQKGAAIAPITKNWYNGWCGSMEIGVLKNKSGSRCKISGVVYENKEIYSLGWLSGITEEMRANPEAYTGRPMEITAMEFDPMTLALRHGKLLGFRDDLTVADCTFEKIHQ